MRCLPWSEIGGDGDGEGICASDESAGGSEEVSEAGRCWVGEESCRFGRYRSISFPTELSLLVDDGRSLLYELLLCRSPQEDRQFRDGLDWSSFCFLSSEDSDAVREEGEEGEESREEEEE